ncbi:MAG TPA: phosphotransferase, partial [Telmatospirillum sp.]|nr:phosphotransferase [Telmatospirillum sp.]
NRLYRIDTIDDRRFALKWYPRSATDPRDRLGAEWGAVAFLERHGVKEVPRGIAFDVSSNFALYEWIDGDVVASPQDNDVQAMIAFAAKLHELRRTSGAETLPQASEACLSAETILTQVDRRLARLTEVAEDEPALAQFLHHEFTPRCRHAEAWARHGYNLLGWRFDRPLPSELMTLSPSDFGFHNALRRADGSIAFIDFEYFGWDDPAKLTADFQQHPGMSLPAPLAEAFRTAAIRLYEQDETFRDRLRLTEPLYVLRWCMILLNEFLPERWEARAFAGQQNDRVQAMRTQLAKARRHLARLSSQVMDFPE